MRKVERQETMEQMDQMMSESSETQRIEFKSDSFSATMSNKSKNFLRAQELELESLEENYETIPDELVAVLQKSHH
jgi:hypothetical protein